MINSIYSCIFNLVENIFLAFFSDFFQIFFFLLIINSRFRVGIPSGAFKLQDFLDNFLKSLFCPSRRLLSLLLETPNSEIRTSQREGWWLFSISAATGARKSLIPPVGIHRISGGYPPNEIRFVANERRASLSQ